EIRYFDSQLAALLRAVAAAGLAGDTLVVVAADHGEEFLEHGEIKHCRTVFDTSIRTPLVLRVPGLGHRAIRARAQNRDSAPTLLAYLGVDASGLGLEGRSLRPAIEGSAANGFQWT